MQRMTNYSFGDVVLVTFVFSDEAGEKRRPAIVLSSNAYNNSRQEAIISALTSKTDRILEGDYLLQDWTKAGLLSPTLATGIIRTIKQDMIYKKLGKLTQVDQIEIKNNLKTILGF
jgi:mRNA interferase MazF